MGDYKQKYHNMERSRLSTWARSRYVLWMSRGIRSPGRPPFHTVLLIILQPNLQQRHTTPMFLQQSGHHFKHQLYALASAPCQILQQTHPCVKTQPIQKVYPRKTSLLPQLSWQPANNSDQGLHAATLAWHVQVSHVGLFV